MSRKYDDDLYIVENTGLEYKYPSPMPVHGSILNVPKPSGVYYHYSNEDSQGALIRQTEGFPGWFDASVDNVNSVYSDRLNSERATRTNNIIGGQDCVWSCRLKHAGDLKLKQAAQAALGLVELPTHVQVIHYFNVSTGYSCPVIAAIYPKTEKEKAEFAERHNLVA